MESLWAVKAMTAEILCRSCHRTESDLGLLRLTPKTLRIVRTVSISHVHGKFPRKRS